MNDFLSALAQQCLINEFIYFETAEETKSILKLEQNLKTKLENSKQPQVVEILCFAVYRPIHKFNWISKFVFPPELSEVEDRLIKEPLSEKNIRKKLTETKTIKDKTSILVKKQYEENPYPRWIKLGLPSKPKTIQKIVKDLDLRIFSEKITKIKSPQILVAGCGTGQHTITTSSRFANSSVTAIDLSKNSIAYAKMKTQELKINNINYVVGDILNLSKLNSQFDIIESVGVLHHMSDPIKGWKVLTNCLKSGGLMKIGLYSKIARRYIIELREFLNKSHSSFNIENIRSLRLSIINSEDKNLNKVSMITDFYNTSEIRDLIFHIQEHQFNLPQIKKNLSVLGLNFCGFEAPEIVKKFKLSYRNINAVIFKSKKLSKHMNLFFCELN